jgi:hypothetical protein
MRWFKTHLEKLLKQEAKRRRVPFDLYGATPSGPSSRGSALGASGPAKPTGVFVALLSGRRGMIAVLAVAIGQGQSLPGGDGRPRLTRQPALRTSFAPGGAPSRRGVDTHNGGLGGGGRGALHVIFLRWRWARIRAATPCARAQLQHLARQDHRRVVLSGLNEPQFPVFWRKT